MSSSIGVARRCPVPCQADAVRTLLWTARPSWPCSRSALDRGADLVRRARGGLAPGRATRTSAVTPGRRRRRLPLPHPGVRAPLRRGHRHRPGTSWSGRRRAAPGPAAGHPRRRRPPTGTCPASTPPGAGPSRRSRTPSWAGSPAWRSATPGTAGCGAAATSTVLGQTFTPNVVVRPRLTDGTAALRRGRRRGIAAPGGHRRGRVGVRRRPAGRRPAVRRAPRVGGGHGGRPAAAAARAATSAMRAELLLDQRGPAYDARPARARSPRPRPRAAGRPPAAGARRWPSTSSPARAATAGSSESRMPNTGAASRRSASSSSE